LAAFGTYSGGAFTPSIIMGSPLLAGYGGTTSFGPISLTSLSFDSGYPVSIKVASGAQFLITSVTSPSFSASVPEPATWAMLILGLGALGCAARLRRRRLDAPAGCS
jgi:hypothetical protein